MIVQKTSPNQPIVALFCPIVYLAGLHFDREGLVLDLSLLRQHVLQRLHVYRVHRLRRDSPQRGQSPYNDRDAKLRVVAERARSLGLTFGRLSIVLLLNGDVDVYVYPFSLNDVLGLLCLFSLLETADKQQTARDGAGDHHSCYRRDDNDRVLRRLSDRRAVCSQELALLAAERVIGRAAVRAHLLVQVVQIVHVVHSLARADALRRLPVCVLVQLVIAGGTQLQTGHVRVVCILQNWRARPGGKLAVVHAFRSVQQISRAVLHAFENI